MLWLADGVDGTEPDHAAWWQVVVGVVIVAAVLVAYLWHRRR